MSSRRHDRQPRVLYLSFYFPPSRASGVYRARATANHLVEQSFDVTVCAAPLRFLYDVVGSVDEDLARTVDPRIAVHRPGMDMFRWELDVRRYGRFRGTLPVLAGRLHTWRAERLFPEPYASWGWASLRTALRLHARQRFDVVLATGNPHAAFAAAWLFHRFTGVPYVLDYRDSWTLNLFTGSAGVPDGHPAWKWERRVLRDAANVVFVNQALRGWHAERYPEFAGKMMVVPNGWDADLMEVPDYPLRSSGPLQFGYLGTLTVSQPVEQMAAAFRRARTHPELAGADLNIYGHLGFFRNSPSILRDRLGLDSRGDEQNDDEAGIHLRGPVPKTDVGRVYRDSDVLVFLAGGGRYVTSGKIFEYMASGRPIVSVHAPESAAREVLDGYPLWFTAESLEVDAVAQSMVAAGKAARDLGPAQVERARRHADGLTRQALLRPLAERLRSLACVPVADAADREPTAMRTDQETDPAPAETGWAPGRPPRVLLLSLDPRPSDRVLAYGKQLAELGVQVDLVVPDRRKLDEVTIPPGVRAHPLLEEENEDLPISRLERLVVYQAPVRILRRARRLTGRYRLARPVDAALALAERGHGKVADAFHHRLFTPFYRQFRPWLLARHSLVSLGPLDPGSADRIVAADVSAVPLAWRLARLHRPIPTTTAMECAPFTDRGTAA